MNFIREIRSFVESECKKPTSKYGYGPFNDHFAPMVKNAEVLADNIGGDKEVITIAAWLHDIGSIIEGRENHHITGAKIAEMKLKELGYPAEKIEIVKKCILSHRGSIGNKNESLEEKIIVDADSITNFDNLAGIFEAAFVYEQLRREEAKFAVRKKLEQKWNQLHFEESRKLVKPKYEAAMLLLN